MVSCLRIKKEKTEIARVFLKGKKWLDENFKIGHSGKYTFLAIKGSADKSVLLSKFSGSIEQRNLKSVSKNNTSNLREALKDILPADKIEQVNRGFEIVGDIAIIEVPEELAHLEKSIAWTLKRIKPHICVVAKKDKKTAGKFRIRKIKVLVGENRTDTIHKESGVLIKLDLNKTYFSARMSSERLRILKTLKQKENILIMFAGAGPYALVLAKRKPDINITAIEWNPYAVKLFNENLKLNHLEKRIKLIKGDAHIEVPKLKEKFDRVIMVLPSGAHEFLKEAVGAVKKNGLIHIYQFEKEEHAESRGKELKQMIEKLGRNLKSINYIRSGYFAPKINRYCYDVILK